MIGFVTSFAGQVFNKLTAAAGLATSIGLKPIKYFIDSQFRDHAIPVAGSVVYSDLWVGAEHSGIYVGDRQISNIVVTDVAESYVRLSDPRDFTSKSIMGRKIYVSCDRRGAVGHDDVAVGAISHVGERSFYGLIFKNCHTFSKKCVNYAPIQAKNIAKAMFTPITKDKNLENPEWELTIRLLKFAAKKRLGASKWRLWDWDNSAQDTPEPDWDAQNDFFRQQALTPEFIKALRMELADAQDYEAEISDEAIPDEIRGKLRAFGRTLTQISDKYDEMAEFLALYPDTGFSYDDFMSCQDTDFTKLAKELQQNTEIKELVRKLGRNYISETHKKQHKIPKASKSEVHGTHHSDDLMRLLPSELVNLEDETLETLFYARLLEKNLLTYELSGTAWENESVNEAQKRYTGPVVACLDTSASMSGEPLHKAKALLFATAHILKQENRSLHVILFGDSGQTKEYTLHGADDLAGLLGFLQGGFGGGTDFDTPLQKALDIISDTSDYQKADILMISDGDCQLSDGFTQKLHREKQRLDCMVYSVLCNGKRVSDGFSDEVLVL